MTKNAELHTINNENSKTTNEMEYNEKNYKKLKKMQNCKNQKSLKKISKNISNNNHNYCSYNNHNHSIFFICCICCLNLFFFRFRCFIFVHIDFYFNKFRKLQTKNFNENKYRSNVFRVRLLQLKKNCNKNVFRLDFTRTSRANY